MPPISIGIGIRSSSTQPVVPAIAVFFNGRPVLFNGRYVTFTRPN